MEPQEQTVPDEMPQLPDPPIIFQQMIQEHVSDTIYNHIPNSDNTDPSNYQRNYEFSSFNRNSNDRIPDYILHTILQRLNEQPSFYRETVEQEEARLSSDINHIENTIGVSAQGPRALIPTRPNLWPANSIIGEQLQSVGAQQPQDTNVLRFLQNQVPPQSTAPINGAQRRIHTWHVLDVEPPQNGEENLELDSMGLLNNEFNHEEIVNQEQQQRGQPQQNPNYSFGELVDIDMPPLVQGNTGKNRVLNGYFEDLFNNSKIRDTIDEDGLGIFSEENEHTWYQIYQKISEESGEPLDYYDKLEPFKVVQKERISNQIYWNRFCENDWKEHESEVIYDENSIRHICQICVNFQVVIQKSQPVIVRSCKHAYHKDCAEFLQNRTTMLDYELEWTCILCRLIYEQEVHGDRKNFQYDFLKI